MRRPSSQGFAKTGVRLESPVVLVTGGAGYIGSHACKALRAAGFNPVAYDNLAGGHREAVRWGPLEQGDLDDGDRLRDVIARYRPAGIMHFAALIAVGESVREPNLYYRNNIGGTAALLNAIEGQKTPLIFSSTAAVYGTCGDDPIAEDAPLDPINPYGRSKLASEWMIRDEHAATDLPFTILRYFNAAGADPDGEIGECHDPETHLIPLALDAVSGRRRLQLFGTDYPTTDGTCVRDYIHVTDLAEAHVLALKRLLGGGGPLIANLGNGAGVSIRQVLDSVARVTGTDVPHDVADRRAGDPAVLVANPHLAQGALDWKPRLSDIDTIVATAWRWHHRGN